MRLGTMAAIVAAAVAAESGLAQFSFFERSDPFDVEPLELESVPEFLFARVQFQTSGSRRRSGWAHDYPRAERNLLRILSEITAVHTEPAAHTVVSLDSPEIGKYPVLYFSEPGTWALSEEEARNFRDYLSRGGFAIFDDFDGPWDWEVFEANMAEVLPGQHFELLEESDPVYQSFFQIEALDVITHPMGHGGPPIFLGIRDERGRLQIVANFNNDIGDYWEWSDQGWYPIDLSNEGYKLGVNYIIYALTH
jgi:hypothetical protein